MENLKELLSIWNFGAAVVVYLTSLAFYRLTLHPLARFPGPKLAAISRYYEAYYDVVQNGQYTFKIKEMHEQYGPIVRISPYELHVNDPAFLDTLYRQDAHYDKYDWTVDAFDAKGSTIFSPAHSVHKARRQPLSPFFSKARVAKRRDMLHRHLDKLCARISALADTRTTFNLGAAIAALARDVANDYILTKSYNSLDREDFDVAVLKTTASAGLVWRLGKHIRWVSPAFKKIPIPFMVKYGGDMKVFFKHLIDTQEDTKALMAAVNAPSSDDASPRSIVHEIMQSRLPDSEKTFERVWEDASVTTAAGNETTASALRLILFHLFSSADILESLRDELAKAGNPSDLTALEQLPYLTAVLMEGLRLSPAIASRMARIAPEAGLRYDKWHIPAGTPVGMTIILIHTNEEIYPKPQMFDPDRWMHPDARKKVDKTFVPFSKGTRNCVGMHLAWAEMYLTVSALAQRFDFRFEDAKAEDFECDSDQFAVGTKAMGMLIAAPSARAG